MWKLIPGMHLKHFSCEKILISPFSFIIFEFYLPKTFSSNVKLEILGFKSAKINLNLISVK